MAAILNDRDIALQASTRTAATNLPVNVNVPGNVTGTIGGTPVQAVLDAAFASSVQPIISESGSNPVGGSHGDSHYNNVTKTMWFNINGTWTVGGTVNASQIIAGTIAAARIGANTITATMLNVSTLSAISANLGTVNAGSITGTADISITGQAVFNGQVSADGGVYSVVCNLSQLSAGGILGYAGTGGFGVRGTASGKGSSSIGVSGSNTTGEGVRGTATSGKGVVCVATTGVALDVQGRMTKTGTELVANLNADRLDSFEGANYCRYVTPNTGSCIVSASGFTIQSLVSGQRTRGVGSTILIETVSDKRTKRKIKKEKLGLKFVNKLNPVTYEDKKRSGFTYHGVISQEVGELIDGDKDALFHTHEDGMNGTDYLSLIGPLIKAVQELSAEVERLKNVKPKNIKQ
ncbi:MAG: tail fiber domain-containing protein [Nitrosomonas sp.]|nr:tail fiber domain-containing protein [Nitrosomonas sp.]